MKHLILIGIISLLFSCTLNRKHEFISENFFSIGTISITGKINNLNKFLFIKQYDLLSGKDDITYVKIDSFGKFQKIIPILNPQEILIEYQNRTVNLLVKQSDNIKLIIDGQSENQEISFSGTAGERSRLLNQYIKSSFELKREYSKNVSGKKLEFLLNMNEKMRDALDSIYEKTFKYTPPDALLSNWIDADNRSIFNFNFIEFASLNEAQPVTFLSNHNLISKMDLNNTDFYCNRSYTLDIFNNYVGGCIIRENARLVSELIDKLKNDNYNYGIKLLADSIFKDFDHIGKDIVLFQFFQQMMQPNFTEMIGKDLNIDLLKECYLQNLNNEYIKNEILNSTYEDNIIKDHCSTNNSEDILEDLLHTFKNEVLYIDICATWCAPCINEFAYSAILNENLNNRVVFIYLFAKSNLTDWKKISKKYNLHGTNILLSDEQYNLLLNKYDIEAGFPQYLIINRNKEIIKGAKRPSSKGIKEDLLKVTKMK